MNKSICNICGGNLINKEGVGFVKAAVHFCQKK